MCVCVLSLACSIRMGTGYGHRVECSSAVVCMGWDGMGWAGMGAEAKAEIMEELEAVLDFELPSERMGAGNRYAAEDGEEEELREDGDVQRVWG